MFKWNLIYLIIFEILPIKGKESVKLNLKKFCMFVKVVFEKNSTFNTSISNNFREIAKIATEKKSLKLNFKGPCILYINNFVTGYLRS